MITMLADHLWQSTLLALAVGALTLLLRHHAARVRYALWLCASLKFLVPFAGLVALGQQLGARALPAASALAIAERTLEWRALAGRVAEPAATVAAGATAEMVRRSAPAAPAALHMDLALVLLLAWAVGTATVLGVWLVRWRKLAAIARRSHLLMTEPLHGAQLEVRVTRSRIEPGVVGIFNPVLLLPDGIAAQLAPAQLRAVLEHELCHVRRLDNLTAALHMLVEALFWFHPLVWWMGARLVEERERACDEAVLAATHDPRGYAEALIAVCEACVRSPLKCAAGVGGTGLLHERVRRLLGASHVRPLGVLQRCAFAAVVLAVMAAPLTIGVLTAPSARAQDVPAQSALPAADPPGVWVMGPRINAVDRSLRELLAFAFHLPKEQVLGPAQLDSTRYTIVAELPEIDVSDVTDPIEQYRAYMRTLIDERFALVLRRETAVVPALSLVAGAYTPGLQPNTTGDRRRWLGRGPSTCGQPNCLPSLAPTNMLLAQGVPIGTLVEFLAATFEMPVVDRTNLTGRYDFKLEWPPETALADRRGLPGNDVLRRVIAEQLGLQLLDADAPVERVVVVGFEGLKDAPPPEATPAATASADPPPVILREPVLAGASGDILELTIDRRGSMYFGPYDEAAVPLDAQTVLAIASAAVVRNPNAPALVTADGFIANHRVMEGANLLQQAGFTRIRFATLPVRPPGTAGDDSGRGGPAR